jgi:molybdopterin-binding protein
MNCLRGIVRKLHASGSMLLVDLEVGASPMTAVLVGSGLEYPWLKEGERVGVTFKETEVFLAKNLQGTLSIRNRFACEVTGIKRGEILTTVQMKCQDQSIGSVITRRASDALSLNVGDGVEALVKTTEVSLMKLAEEGMKE